MSGQFDNFVKCQSQIEIFTNLLFLVAYKLQKLPQKNINKRKIITARYSDSYLGFI